MSRPQEVSVNDLVRMLLELHEPVGTIQYKGRLLEVYQPGFGFQGWVALDPSLEVILFTPEPDPTALDPTFRPYRIEGAGGAWGD